MSKKKYSEKRPSGTRLNKARSKRCLVYADAAGSVYDFPGREPAFRTGRRFVRVDPGELIPLPEGSVLFTLPGRAPVYYDGRTGGFKSVDRSPDGEPVSAVSAFLSSAYLRTYLPAFEPGAGSAPLSLWAYAGVVLAGDDFLAPALRVDDDPRSDPAIHNNDRELVGAISETVRLYPGNRLVGQLAKCGTEYRCLCARNFFLGRHEAPVPTTPACNAECLGCLSHQEEGAGFRASQDRLDFSPSPAEIAEVITHHLSRVKRGVASFGQGCEGEPLLRGEDLAAAVALVRAKTGAGTININTNGSRPDMVRRLIDAGIDSIRISLNSPTPDYYRRYYRPRNFSFDDVLRSLGLALDAGIFVSLNLFFLPGFTDAEQEAESLFSFLRRFPVNLLQTRNLNIDPDLYLDTIGFADSEPLGVRRLLAMLREQFPALRLGYYNPPLRD